MYYKPQEAAQYLGIAIKDLRKAIYEDRIGYVRISPHRTRFTKENLDTFKAGWKRSTPASKNAEQMEAVQ